MKLPAKKNGKNISSKDAEPKKRNFKVKILTQQDLDARRCAAYKLLIP